MQEEKRRQEELRQKELQLEAIRVQQEEERARQSALRRQEEEIERNRQQAATVLPEQIDYAQVMGLSNEVRQKLMEHRPTTLGQASRISGITPAALSLLLVHLKKRELRRA